MSERFAELLAALMPYRSAHELKGFGEPVELFASQFSAIDHAPRHPVVA